MWRILKQDAVALLIHLTLYDILISHQSKQNKKPFKYRKTAWSKRKTTQMVAMNVLAFAATTKYQHVVRVDTNSEAIGIDNRASACISRKADDFVSDLKDCNRVIKGYMGSRTSNI